MTFSKNYNMCSLGGKFGKRVLLERNLGNNCLMIWGRHIEAENIPKIIDWLMEQWPNEIYPDQILKLKELKNQAK